MGFNEMRAGTDDHVPESLLETDHEIEARRPGLGIIDKRGKSCQIIDVAVPEYGRVREKEDEKVEVPRSSERRSKNMGCEDKGYSSGSRSIGINTTEIE